MSQKRQKTSHVEQKQNIMWKVKPPGPEQRELERMFKTKEFDPASTPDSVRQLNDMFLKFNAVVFANHYRATKAKLGLSGLFYTFIF